MTPSCILAVLSLPISCHPQRPTPKANPTHAVLDAPGNSPERNNGNYTCQIVVSWPVRDGFFSQASPIAFPDTDEGGIELVKKFAETWADPFRSLARRIDPRDAEVKYLELSDWPPPKGLRTTGHVALVGDAFHPMTMCKWCPLLATRLSQFPPHGIA